jgi:hypothetical protein
VIGFGKTQHGFYNEPTFHSTIGDACSQYNAHLHNPETDGAVLIRVRHESWEVIQEFCSENYRYSVIYGIAGNFKVGLVPDLVMV